MTRLGDREKLLAPGLAFLANKAYPEACSAYEALRRLDDTDFAAWFGLGECRRSDLRVESDPSFPTRWRFRASYHQGILAYQRAFEVEPASHRGFRDRGFAGIRGLFYTGADGRIIGWTVPDSMQFIARPVWRGDTIT